MKNTLIPAIFLSSVSVFGTDSPIDFEISKVKGDDYRLEIIVPKGYAVQKDAPNKIELKGDDHLKVKSFKSEFKGTPMVKKPEYFEKVQSFPVKLSGKGELTISSKIFYCDLNKNVCYPAKISKTEHIK